MPNAHRLVYYAVSQFHGSVLKFQRIRVKSLILDCKAAEKRDHWTDKNFQLTTASFSHEISRTPTLTQLMPSDHTADNMIDIIH